MASFPNSIWSPTTKNTNDVITGAFFNDPQSEIVAIETAALTSGSWTPTIISSGGGTPTYSVQTGTYLQIGKLILAAATVQLATKGTLGAGTVSIGGLPAQSATVANQFFGAVISSYSMTTAVTALYGTIQAAGAVTISLGMTTAAATAASNVNVSDLSATSSFTVWTVYVTV